MIGILSYGLGNILAVKNVFDDININCKFLYNPSDINNQIKKIVLPGVGSFDQAMSLLGKKKFIDPLKQFVKDEKNMLLGICVGMQILANDSEEGNRQGLGLIPGSVRKFDNIRPIPHVGWNDVLPVKDEFTLLDQSEINKFYFLHSFYFDPINKNHTIGFSKYFYNFSSVIRNKNIIGVQFHPEKSHLSGQKFFKKFSEL